MRISDWSSDVCSSDLEREAERDRGHPAYLAERWIRESGIHANLADEGGYQAQATFQDLRLPVDVERLCRRRCDNQARKQPADHQGARQEKFPGLRTDWFHYPDSRWFAMCCMAGWSSGRSRAGFQQGQVSSARFRQRIDHV